MDLDTLQNYDGSGPTTLRVLRPTRRGKLRRMYKSSWRAWKKIAYLCTHKYFKLYYVNKLVALNQMPFL